MGNDCEKETFRYTYSAKQQNEIQNIRKKYAAPEENKMEQLRRLDAGVTKKAASVSLAVGIVGVLLLGFGMSLVMTDIGAVFHFSRSIGILIGVLIGIVGMAVVALAYPLYLKVIREEREKIAPEILRLTDELMK